MSKQAFELLCQSLVKDAWIQTKYTLQRKDGVLEVWTASGFWFLKLYDPRVHFNLIQKFVILKYIRIARSNHMNRRRFKGENYERTDTWKNH